MSEPAAAPPAVLTNSRRFKTFASDIEENSLDENLNQSTYVAVTYQDSRRAKPASVPAHFAATADFFRCFDRPSFRSLIPSTASPAISSAPSGEKCVLSLTPSG